MNNITRIGLDLAKHSFALSGVDSHENIVLERTLKRHELLGFFANLPLYCRHGSRHRGSPLRPSVHQYGP